MENEEQPQREPEATELSKEERIEAHFTTANDHWNKYTFDIYTSVTKSGLFDDVEVPLNAFRYADSFIYVNRDKPLSVVKALINYFDEQNPPFTNEQKRFVLNQLICYYHSTVFTDPDDKEYSLDRIEKLLKQERAKLPEPAKDAVVEYDWSATKAHLSTLPDTSAKIAYLLEQKAAYKQQDTGWNIDLGPKYDQQCQTEIKKLRDLTELEQRQQTPKSPFKLSDKTGAKTNIIRLLNALYELHLIELENGQRPTKEQFMRQIGGFLGVDMKRYEQTLSKALEQPIETNLEIIKELEIALKKQVFTRLEKNHK